MTDKLDDAQPSKRPRIEQSTAKGSTLMNVVEIDGKSCTHEVSWPPGMFSISPNLLSAAAAPRRYFNPFKQPKLTPCTIYAIQMSNPPSRSRCFLISL